jgi:GNAT superfamily N-acetyltransferase
MESPDAALVKGWLAGRSIARGLPAPVDDSGGWRVDTGLPDELRRHVFVEPTAGLQKLARSLHQPKVLLKLCGSEETMRPLLPPRWRIRPGGFFMTSAGGFEGPAPLPPGYEMTVSVAGGVVAATVRTGGGAIAAQGFAAETEDTFVYDRIVTDVAHRRRGLARAVMKALGTARRSTAARPALVATDEGRALYSTMGWIVRSPWTTAAIPETQVPVPPPTDPRAGAGA